MKDTNNSSKMKVLVVDHASKTGWVYGEMKDGKNEIISYGKFRASGKTEKERVKSLHSETSQLIGRNEFMDVDVIVFEEPFAGSNKTSLKTLKSSYGRRYTLIEVAGNLRPAVPLYGVSPKKWWKVMPDEPRLSKIDFKKDGSPKNASGKEKKINTLNFINKIYDKGLEWHNEGVNCENDIADAMAIFWLLAEGRLIEEDLEKVG